MKTYANKIIAAIVLFCVLGLIVYKFVNINEALAVEKKTAFVVINDESTKELGPMPIDRKYIADAITKLKQYGAKGVAIKFFYDRETPSDGYLASSMKGIPVLLQYSLFDKENDGRTTPRITDSNSANNLLHGKPDMVPNSILKENMNSMGFVNSYVEDTNNHIVMIGGSNKQIVESLQLKIMRLVSDSKISVDKNQIHIGNHNISINSKGEISCGFLNIGKPNEISMVDILKNNVDPAIIKDKVVVIGYVRSDSPIIKYTLFHSMPIHEYFYRQIMCIAGLM